MAILIDETKRVLVQGITGREGRARTRLMREYGTNVVAGTVIGKIVASQRVEIHRNGKVYSDVDTPALVIEEGAIFQGNCVMGERKGNVTNISAKA